MKANESVVARLAALKTMSAPELKEQWRRLFDSEPPMYTRPNLESRLAYRIQELAFGGLKRATVERLNALADEIEGKGASRKRKSIGQQMPIAGTRLIREWKGVEHSVTVLADGFEHHGHRYKSLSAIARAITGTRWNGLVFFGLKSTRTAR